MIRGGSRMTAGVDETRRLTAVVLLSGDVFAFANTLMFRSVY